MARSDLKPPTTMPRLPLLLGLIGLAGLAACGLGAQPSVDVPLGVTGTLVDERGVATAGVEVVLRPYPSDYEIDLDLLSQDALPPAVDRGPSGLDDAQGVARFLMPTADANVVVSAKGLGVETGAATRAH